MATKSKRFDLRTTPEVYEAVREKAESQGLSVNEFVEQAMKAQVEGVRQGAVQNAAQSTVQDYGEQLGRIEHNQDVLRRAMLAMAERQEAEIAALVAIAERQEMHEQGMRAMASGMQAIAESAKQLPAKEPPALPAPERKMTEADYWREYHRKRKAGGDAGVHVIEIRYPR